MPVSLQRVQEILKQQQQQEKAVAAPARGGGGGAATTKKDNDDNQELFSKLLLRPLPPTLYTCPISEPTTTVVPYHWLPKRVQEKIDLSKARIFCEEEDKEDDIDDEDVIIVEIPVAWMTEAATNEETSSLVAGSLLASSSGRRSRPTGNLSDKLTEYTRGSHTQQPFRPGGMMGTNASRIATTTSQSERHSNDTENSSSSLERHQKVLVMDTAELWKQGLLTTAPPGASFTVGLSWEQVHGGQSSSSSSAAAVVQQEDENEDNEKGVGQYPMADSPLLGEDSVEASSPAQRKISAPLFSKSYFDDDSLFGSSSSSSDSDDDDEEEDSDNNDDVEDIDNEKEVKNENKSFVGTTDSRTTMSTGTTIQQNDSIDNDGDDIDTLLTELTLDPMKSKSAAAVDVPANPLELAERQAKDQFNTTRKEWANTKYLPIRDFDALIPNPALVFPFPLDDFQQQAVARLERNEVRLVRCVLPIKCIFS